MHDIYKSNAHHSIIFFKFLLLYTARHKKNEIDWYFYKNRSDDWNFFKSGLGVRNCSSERLEIRCSSIGLSSNYTIPSPLYRWIHFVQFIKESTIVFQWQGNNGDTQWSSTARQAIANTGMMKGGRWCIVMNPGFCI